MSHEAPHNSTAPEPQDDLVGSMLANKYAVERLLAAGGMGRIYVATQVMLNRQVAIKILNTSSVQSEQSIKLDTELEQRFLREAAICAQLTHNNTVHVYDYGAIVKDGVRILYMVMELIHGITLRQRLDAMGPFEPDQALYVIREVARSLNEAHRIGIVHRDLKPSNIMLVPCEGDNDAVKVLDFGIAKLLESHETASDLTGQDKMIGTPRYMAPEMVIHGEVDHRTDIYCLGVLLYELLCGMTPFDGEPIAVAIAHVNNPPPPIAQLSGIQVPADVEEIALRCMRKKPEERYQNVIELIQAIDLAMDHLLMQEDRMFVEMMRPQLTSNPDVSGLTEAPTQPPNDTHTTKRSLSSNRFRKPTGSMPDPRFFTNPNFQALVLPTNAENPALTFVIPTGEHNRPNVDPSAEILGMVTNMTTSPLPTKQVVQLQTAEMVESAVKAAYEDLSLEQALINTSPSQKALKPPPESEAPKRAHYGPYIVASVVVLTLGAIVLQSQLLVPKQQVPSPATPDAQTQMQLQPIAGPSTPLPTETSKPIDAKMQTPPEVPVDGPTQIANAPEKDETSQEQGVATKAKQKITSQPEGAKVSESKVTLCTTPCGLEQTGKARKLTFTLQNYKTKTVQLQADQAELNVTLEKRNGGSTPTNKPNKNKLRDRR